MTSWKSCLNCGTKFRWDPADGLEQYCGDCYPFDMSDDEESEPGDKSPISSSDTSLVPDNQTVSEKARSV